MILTAGVDPGATAGCGAAVACDGRLLGAKLVRPPSPGDRGPVRWARIGIAAMAYLKGWGSLDRVALEYPQVYTAGKGKGDPNDLFPVACVAQSIAVEAIRDAVEVLHYLPRDWKGTIDKLANTHRVRQRLTPDEFSRIEIPPNTCSQCASREPTGPCERAKPPPARWEPCLIHNVYDGVGILLKALGRFERHRVIPR